MKLGISLLCLFFLSCNSEKNFIISYSWKKELNGRIVDEEYRRFHLFNKGDSIYKVEAYKTVADYPPWDFDQDTIYPFTIITECCPPWWSLLNKDTADFTPDTIFVKDTTYTFKWNGYRVTEIESYQRRAGPFLIQKKEEKKNHYELYAPFTDYGENTYPYYSLNGDTVRSSKWYSASNAVVSYDLVSYTGKETKITIGNTKRDVYVFHRGNKTSLNKNNYSIEYVDKKLLLPILTEYHFFDESGVSKSIHYADSIYFSSKSKQQEVVNRELLFDTIPDTTMNYWGKWIYPPFMETRTKYD